MKNNWLRRLRTRIKEKFDANTNDTFRTNILTAVPFWLAALLTGLVAVAYTRLFNYSEGILHSILLMHSWLLFLITPVCFLLAYFTVRLFADNAKGSGIPQVMAAIDLSATNHEKSINKLLSIRIMLTKIASSTFMVLGGGAIGREGPTIQVSGSIFRMVSRWVPASWPRVSQKSFILTGAAAGLAAAFNTPLGGIVFAIEELAKIHISFFRTALFTSVIIAGLTAQGFLGPYLYLGYPDVTNLTPLIYVGVVATAVLAGLAGAFMCKVTLTIMRWKKNFSTWQNIAFITAAALLFASIAVFVNQDILGSGKDLMNQALFTQQKHMDGETVLARILGPILAFTTGGAGGIFAPSLAAGASIGAFLSGLFHILGANANILILSGMVGFLTGVTRTPFTSAILVLEMTDRHSVIFHLMLAGLVANLVALAVDKHSFYEQLKEGYIEDVKKLDEVTAAIE